MHNDNNETEQNIQQLIEASPKVVSPPIWSYKLEGRYGRLNFINSIMVLFGIVVVPAVCLSAVLYYLVVKFVYFSYSFSSAMLSGLLVAGLFALVVGIFYFLAYLRMVILRLHDLNLNGACALLVVGIPIIFSTLQIGFLLLGYRTFANIVALFSALISLATFVLLVAVPGTSGENKYGVPSVQGPFNGLIIMISLFVLYIIVIVAVIYFAFFIGTYRYY